MNPRCIGPHNFGLILCFRGVAPAFEEAQGFESAARTEGGAEHRGGGVEEVWIWLAALLLTLALLPLAFFVGCRSGRRRASSHNEKPKCISSGQLSCAGTPTKISLDQAALCNVGFPPCSTPPAVALFPPEYAEVRPAEQCASYSSSAPYAEIGRQAASLRACSNSNAPYAEVVGETSWRASDASAPYAEVTSEAASRRTSYQSSHHYEDLGADSGERQPYADSVSPYAETLPVPSTLQPPVASYIYAQVDKKKKKKRNVPPLPSSPPPPMSSSSSADFTVSYETLK